MELVPSSMASEEGKSENQLSKLTSQISEVAVGECALQSIMDRQQTLVDYLAACEDMLDQLNLLKEYITLCEQMSAAQKVFPESKTKENKTEVDSEESSTTKLGEGASEMSETPCIESAAEAQKIDAESTEDKQDGSMQHVDNSSTQSSASAEVTP